MGIRLRNAQGYSEAIGVLRWTLHKLRRFEVVEVVLGEQDSTRRRRPQQVNSWQARSQDDVDIGSMIRAKRVIHGEHTERAAEGVPT